MDTDRDDHDKPGGSESAPHTASPGQPALSSAPVHQPEPRQPTSSVPPRQQNPPPRTHAQQGEAETYTIEELKALLSLQAEWQLLTLERDAAADEVERAREDAERVQQAPTDSTAPSNIDEPSPESAADDAAPVAKPVSLDHSEQGSSCKRQHLAEIRWREYMARRAEALSCAYQTHLTSLQSKVASRKADLAARRDRLAQARDKVLKEGVEREAARYQTEVQTQRLQLHELQRQIHLRRQKLVQKLEEVFPIVPVDASALLFSIHGILLPVPAAPSEDDPRPPPASRTPTDSHDPQQLLARAYEPNSMASGLALVVQLITLLSMYLGIPLHYDVAQAGSWGVIHDDISPYLGPRVFPLYLEGEHERYRFEYAVFLLEKNVENLLRKLCMSVLDLRAILPNLKNLTVTYTSDPGPSTITNGQHPARTAPRARLGVPSTNGSPLSSAATSRRSSWMGSSIRVLPPSKPEAVPSFSLKMPSSPTYPSRLGAQLSPASEAPTSPPRRSVQGGAQGNGGPVHAGGSLSPHVKVRAFAPSTRPAHGSNLRAASSPQAMSPQSSSQASNKDIGGEPISGSTSPSPTPRPALKQTSSFSSWLPWRTTLSSPAPSAAPGNATEPVPVLRTLGKS